MDIEASIRDAKTEVKAYVIDWIMKAMVYYYQGGAANGGVGGGINTGSYVATMGNANNGGEINRLSLVITDKDAFDSAVNELKTLCIPNEISIILVSTEQNVIIDEFVVPQKYFKII